MLSDIPAQNDDRVLMDFRTSDDAGVYRWEGGPAIVQTVDFFTPIVDDPYVYGQIAAANSVSDIYAMGARPVTALAIAGFPDEDFDVETIRAIFRGGFDKLREAGVALLGGHTVRDPELKFGYAVTGAVDPERILSNGGAQPGDVLFLTKPLGTGLVGTAIKFDRAPARLMAQAVDSMRTLNRAAAEALATLPAGCVHACTDVTGFGFAGHATEMARASRVTLEVEVGKLPLFDGVLEIAATNRSGGLSSNEAHFGPGVRWSNRKSDSESDSGSDSQSDSGSDSRSGAWRLVAFDPQTSGGLLVAVDPSCADAAAGAFLAAGVNGWRIGRAIPGIPHISIHMI